MTASSLSHSELPYTARLLNPAHPDLANGAGVPAQLANEAYVESLARIIYYWAYPLVDAFGRISSWELMKDKGPGASMGLFPAAPKNHVGYLDDYMPPSQRRIVTPNNDTIYGAGSTDLSAEPVVVQTPSAVAAGHYWTVQLTDVFTNVFRQLGSASGTPGGKFLLVGPDWDGAMPEGYLEIIRAPTNVSFVLARTFTAHSPEQKAVARTILNQMGAVPLSEDRPGPLRFDCEASARNKVFPPGLTAAMVETDPEVLRGRPVDVRSFWEELGKALDFNPVVGPDDRPMAAQARTLLALHGSSPSWRAFLDRVALAADAELHESARYHQQGVDAGNGWLRHEDGGMWGTDWFGRAQAAITYIFANDFHEAVYFLRGTDAAGSLLQGRYRYTMTFPKDALPPVDRTRGGFWSLTMYDKDYYMLARPPRGRTNLGTVNLDANELMFADDGSLILTIGSEEPKEAAASANWLPAPDDQFALIVRTYVPTEPILDGSYRLPDVMRVKQA